MSIWKALGSGVAGAVVLTLIHETARRQIKDAPRMDRLGEQAIEKALVRIDKPVPSEAALHQWSLAGDLIGNSLFYSLVGAGSAKGGWLRGMLLGLGAGIGGVLLPKPLKMDTGASSRTPQTQAMTVAWYLLGGLAAAAVNQLLSPDKE